MSNDTELSQKAPSPQELCAGLKGTAAKLAQLVIEHGHYDFEGFTWLPCNRENVAKHLGVDTRTIGRIIEKAPFHHISRDTEEYGKHVLVKIGTAPCETDHVFRLRALWVQGLAYFNAAAVTPWKLRMQYLKDMEAPADLQGRMLHRIAAAEEGAKTLAKLQAGEKVSFQVKAYQIVMLRKIVQALGDDAYGVVAHLVTFEGWSGFMGYLKAEERSSKHMHWPELVTIASNLDIAVQAYLDELQATGKINLGESARLLAKAESLKPAEAA